MKCKDCGGQMLELFTSVVCRDDCGNLPRASGVWEALMRKVPRNEHKYMSR